VQGANASESQFVHVKALVNQHLHNFCATMLCRKRERVFSGFDCKREDEREQEKKQKEKKEEERLVQ